MAQGTNLLHKGQDADLGALTYKLSPPLTKTAAYTVLASDSGKVFEADAAASVVFTLPATAPGLTFTFVVKQLPGSGVGTSVSPNAADKFIGNGFTPADDKDAINTAATDRLGDSITIVGDAVGDGWWITAVSGTWARE